MLKNAYLLAKICTDTAENEQRCCEILPIGRPVADPGGGILDGGHAPRAGGDRPGPRRAHPAPDPAWGGIRGLLVAQAFQRNSEKTKTAWLDESLQHSSQNL